MGRVISFAPRPKIVRWLRDSRKILKGFPPEVRQHIGRALWEAQLGEKAVAAKPLKGFGGAGVLEIVESFDGNAYRAVYTVRYAAVVYVLATFQKKSKKGSTTPRSILALIDERLRIAAEDHASWQKEE